MTIKWQDWLIEDFKKGYGYVVKRRVGESDRWKAEGYYDDLCHAVQSLFKERVRTETASDIIDALDAATTRLRTARLLKKIDDIANELLEGLR